MTDPSTINRLPLDVFHYMTTHLNPRDIDALACVDKEHLGRVEACRFSYKKNLFNYMVAHQMVDRLDLLTLAGKRVENCNSYDEEIIRSVVDPVLKEISEFCAKFPDEEINFSNPYKIPSGAEFYENRIESQMELVRFSDRKKEYDKLNSLIKIEKMWFGTQIFSYSTQFLVCANVQSQILLDGIKVYSELVNLCESSTGKSMSELSKGWKLGTFSIFCESILAHKDFNTILSNSAKSEAMIRIKASLEKREYPSWRSGRMDERTIMSYNEWQNLKEESNCFMRTLGELESNIELFCEARDNIIGLETLGEISSSKRDADSEKKVQTLVFEELNNRGFQVVNLDYEDKTFPYLEMSEAINDIFRDPSEELKSEMQKIVILESDSSKYRHSKSFFKLEFSLPRNLIYEFMPGFYRFFPNLRELHLRSLKNIQIEQDGFPSLKFLSVNEVEKIEIRSDSLQTLDMSFMLWKPTLIDCPSLEMIQYNIGIFISELQELGERIDSIEGKPGFEGVKLTGGLFYNSNQVQPSEMVNEQPVDFDFENQKLLEDIKSNYGDQGLLQIDAERANIENALDVSRIKNSALVDLSPDQIQNLALQRFYNRLLLESYTIKLESDFGREALDQFYINVARQTGLRYIEDSNSVIMQLFQLEFPNETFETLFYRPELNLDKAKEFGISNQYNDAQIFTNSMKYILEKYENKISNDSEIISDSE